MEHLNYYVLLIFAPLLILTGLIGFIVPAKRALTSGAFAYNLFHIAFGVLGFAVLYWGNDTSVRAFNIGFGLIDLYQAAASILHLFPERHFRWKQTDNVLHIVIGLGLVVVGLL